MDLEELFKEYFPGWAKDIEKIEKTGTDEILVTLKPDRKYRFGQRTNEVYLETIREEKKHGEV